MWALQRASNSTRSCGYRFGIPRSISAKACVLNNDLTKGWNKQYEHHLLVVVQTVLPKALFSHVFGAFPVGTNYLSSQAGSKSGDEEDDLEYGFSELEVPQEAEIAGDDATRVAEENSEESISELEVSEDESEGDISEGGHVSDVEVGPTSKATRKNIFTLYKSISLAPPAYMDTIMNRWVEDGNSLQRTEISVILMNLRKRKLFAKALQLMEWLEANKKMEYTESVFASRLDLIAKVHGITKAEKYVNSIPNSLRTEVVYRTLLASCCAIGDVKKTEEVFNKMRDLGFPLTAFATNQLLLLYKRVGRKKIVDVLLMMEKEEVKPTLFTYKLLIDVKGRTNDIEGMEQIMETMKVEGVEPDLFLQSVIARHYIFCGKPEKAEKMMEEMEAGDLKENRKACAELLPLYAALGKSEEVIRVWKECEDSLRFNEAIAAIESWGKLGQVEKAEAVLEKAEKMWKRPFPKVYTAMLRVYGDHKLLLKGKDLVKKMSESGYLIGPETLDALVRLYLQAGEVEKADAILNKAVQNRKMKPMYSSYIEVLKHYAGRGDVHSSEKIFDKLRTMGYAGPMQQYQNLLQAYINAKVPAYGFRERMKADNVFPNRTLAAMLMQVDALKKKSVIDFLD